MSYKTSLFGRLPLSWKISKVKDYCEVTDYVANGSFKSLAKNVRYNHGDKYAVLIRLTDYNNNFKDEFVYINEDAYNFLSKTKLYGNEIIISNVGANVGTVFLAPTLNKKMSLGPNTIMIKTKGFDQFYYYWFKSKIGQHLIESIVTGSAQPKFNKTNFRQLEIPVPPIDEQKNISFILYSLDNRIELNNKINEKLETLAQTLYKHWFVDFDFPNEEGLPYKSSGGKMVESELGLIPEGWEVIKLKDIFTYINGFPFKSKDYTENGRFKVITIRNVKDGFFDLSNVSRIDNYPDKIKKNQILNIGDILMSLTGNVGRVALVDEDNCLLNQRVVNIHTNEELKGLVYTILRNKDMFEKIVSLGKGSAQQNLSPIEMSNIKLPFPKDIKKYNVNYFNNIINKVIANNIENKNLSNLRDLLLPKLMSGEIRVPIEEE